MELPPVNRGHDAVGAEHQTVEQRPLDRRAAAQQAAVAINAGTGHTIKPLGDVEALELQHGLGAGRGLEPHTAIAEAVLGILIAVASNVEKDLPVH